MIFLNSPAFFHIANISMFEKKLPNALQYVHVRSDLSSIADRFNGTEKPIRHDSLSNIQLSTMTTNNYSIDSTCSLSFIVFLENNSSVIIFDNILSLSTIQSFSNGSIEHDFQEKKQLVEMTHVWRLCQLLASIAIHLFKEPNENIELLNSNGIFICSSIMINWSKLIPFFFYLQGTLECLRSFIQM
jgi:hypothetical protein